jgi:site-specific DNA recombinase
VRQESLDQIVWDEIIRLLDDPSLIQSEIDRRRQAAFETNPSRKREEELRREQARLEKNMERMISAYQEALVTLPQLRQRMPELHRQIHAVEAELHSLEIAAVDDARYLQLAETLATFRGKLRARAETLDVGQRQQILRLLVKEILVGSDTITIRHSLPIAPSGSGPAGMTPPDSGMIGTSSGTGYLLRSGSHHRPLRSALLRLQSFAFFQDPGLHPFLNQAEHSGIRDAMLQKLLQPLVTDVIEEALDIRIQNPVHSLPGNPHIQCIQRLMRITPRPEPIRKAFEVHLVNLVEDGHHSLLNNLVLQTRDAQRALLPVGLRYIDSSRGLRPVRAPVNPAVEIRYPVLQSVSILPPSHAVHPRRSLPL